MDRWRIDRICGPPGALVDGAGRTLAGRCHTADRWGARLVGLLATPDLLRCEALWLPRCRSIHTMGLRAPIGCAFLDGGGRVLRVCDPVPRNRIVGCPGSHAVVECHAGVLRGVDVGEALRRVTTGGAFPAVSAHSGVRGRAIRCDVRP